MTDEQQPEQSKPESAASGQARRHDDSPEEAADRRTDSSNPVGGADSAGVAGDRGVDKVGDGDLRPDDDLIDEPDIVDAEVVDSKVRRVIRREVRQTLTAYEGPLPPAEEFKSYNDVLPGAADRILSMAEKALDTQAEVDTTLAHGDVQAVRRGQWQSTAIVGGSLTAALVSVVLKAPWEAVAVFAAPSFFEFASSLIRTIREPRKKDDES